MYVSKMLKFTSSVEQVINRVVKINIFVGSNIMYLIKLHLFFYFQKFGLLQCAHNQHDHQVLEMLSTP
jgi:hypothetical protein